ncbi:hypothetical protein [Vibrio sp. AND4]|uniref:hypothetical protein n=1 Tax=Vibrio sp. AND4 TaxID=314289 RepID=UPI00015F3A93|nr:hypothetical protein [Vibrio sp. AND4]EDP57154.1 lipopolysaccharide core biosynthesis protein [Vibrio sp. AND4]
MAILESRSLILIGFNTDYQRLEVEEISGQWNVYDFRMNFILYFLCSKLMRFNLTKKIVTNYYKYRKKRLPISNYKVIVTDDPIDMYGIHAFEKKDVKVLMRNSVLGDDKLLSIFSGYSVYSFDPKDCEDYGFEVMKQFIPCAEKIQEYCSDKYKVDFFFLGLDKGRGVYLNSLEKKLNDFGFTTKFLVKSPPIGFFQKIDKWIKGVPKYKMLTYQDNLNNVSECRCIVELVQEGQSGITLRTLEAMFFKKKLITNNKEILGSEVFVSNNILYVESLDEIEEDSIRNFINSPYENYPSSTLKKYTISENLREIILRD